MSKKFFSLIYGDQLHQAPGKKIIPADSFSKLLEATEILDHIKAEAEKYRQEVVEECEKIKENAYKEGYDEGLKAWSEQLVLLEKEAENIRLENQKVIIPIALKAAKKIVAKELELSETTIVDIVESNLRAVSQHKKITIYVNRKDLEILEKNKSRLKNVFENLESFSIRERDDITEGGCTIESEIGIINAQIEHRWSILEKAFQSLIKVPSDKNQSS